MTKELGSTNIAALKMKDSNSNEPLKYEDGNHRYNGTLSKLYKQVPILFEGCPDAVADISGVDGINFKIRYSLTTKNNIKTMEIHKNPCKRIDNKFHTEVGCYSPFKKECHTGTCDCKPVKECKDKGTQSCKFNDFSKKCLKFLKNLLYIKTNMTMREDIHLHYVITMKSIT